MPISLKRAVALAALRTYASSAPLTAEVPFFHVAKSPRNSTTITPVFFAAATADKGAARHGIVRKAPGSAMFTGT
jgi:hypothetical protein